MEKTWCQQRGLKLADEKFNDAGVSAKNGANQKQDLGRLVNTVKPGDTVLIEDHDRLSRMDWFSAMDFLRSILANGVTVVTLATGAEITEEKFRRDPGCF